MQLPWLCRPPIPDPVPFKVCLPCRLFSFSFLFIKLILMQMSSSHANVHSQFRPYYCPVQGCPRSEGGKGFKRKNEMIRHGLVHDSPGYVCPFCPDQRHRYPRPDNLQRYVKPKIKKNKNKKKKRKRKKEGRRNRSFSALVLRFLVDPALSVVACSSLPLRLLCLRQALIQHFTLLFIHNPTH